MSATDTSPLAAGTIDRPPTVTRPGRQPVTSPPEAIPLSRIVGVELRKSFDTRAGFWLLAGAGIASVLTTAVIIAFADASELTYGTFTLAIAFPMSVILPIIAVLSVTAEWSQRSGLSTFTLVPHRSRVMLAKAVAAAAVAPVATLLAFGVGAMGNLVGSVLAGTPRVWDQAVADVLQMTLANVLLVLVGFTLGVLIRSSSAAIVAYFLYGFVAPGLLTLLAMSQQWFRDLQPWVDPSYTQDALLQGAFSGEQWTQLAVTCGIWLVVPMAAGLLTLVRAEVK
jgi:ABC-2 type transport system permease protein